MKYLLIILLSVLVVSCKVPAVMAPSGSVLIPSVDRDSLTRDQIAAQRKLRKAIKKDPNIIRRIRIDTILRGVINAPVTIEVPGIKKDVDLDCEKLRKQLHDIKNASVGPKDMSEVDPGIYLYQDSLIRIRVMLDSMGKMYASFEVEPRIIHDTVPVPYEIPVSVEGVAVSVNVHDSWYSHWLSWVLVAISLFMAYLWISSRRKNVEIKLTNGENSASHTG